MEECDYLWLFMRYLLQALILLACLGVGELLVYLTHLPVPPSILGMLVLSFLLYTGWIKLNQVQELSGFLLKYLSLFFVPAGVAIMQHFDLIERTMVPILAASFISFIAALLGTAFTHQWLRRFTKNFGREKTW